MGSIRSRNTFEKGINTDISSDRLPNNQMRDAVNVDILETGNYARLENIKGTTYLQTFSQNVSNILGAFSVEARYDYDGDGIFEQTNPSILIYCIGGVGAGTESQIHLYDTKTNNSVQLYPNATDSTSLDFPPEGTVGASYTKERGIPEAYWDDNKNELRSIRLEYSTDPLWTPPSLRELGVRKRLAGLAPILDHIGTGGFLLAGTYQFAFRLYSKTTCNYSDWTFFCNPIAIAPANCVVDDAALGGKINQVTNKSITLSLTLNSIEAPFYDSIQLAIIKNIDGLTVPSNVAYVTLPNEDWYNDPTSVTYKGDTGNEVETAVEDIITEDASIRCAKDQVIKNNRLFRGNITYYESENDRNGDRYESAETITREVNYKCGEDTNRYKGYWRDECYAFARAYYDEYNNVRLVEPFDFASQHFGEPTGLTTTLMTAVNQGNGYFLCTFTDVSNLELGGLIKLPNGNTLLVCEIGVGFALLQGVVSGALPATVQILRGEDGNYANTWSWKFAPRNSRNYTILNESSRPQALGLRIKGIKNHPTWAKGFVIVRQERKKNILGQSPHIPTVAVMGVPTQGVGPITYEKDNPQKLDFNLSDYTGDKDVERAQENLDTITPKIFGFGNAKNIAAKNVYITVDRILAKKDRYWAVQYPYYANQIYDWDNIPFSTDNGLNTPATDQIRGGEIPRYIGLATPEYVMNRAGEPTYSVSFTGQEYLRAVDAVQLKRKILVGEDPQLSIANVYQALDRSQYLYTKEGYVLRDINTTPYKEFDYRVPFIDGRIYQNTINLVNPVTLASPFFLLDEKPCVSTMFEDIELYGAMQDLSAQQGFSNAVPNSTSSFLNLMANQRLLLVRPQTPFCDFTLHAYNGLYGSDEVNYFPNSSVVMPNTVFTTSQLENNYIYLPPIGGGSGVVPVKNIFVADEDESVGGAWILNIYKGLPDDRYSQISTEWVSTGAMHEFTGTEVADNTPIDMDVWGGDCFVTKYAVKINNNGQRISDPFECVPDESNDYEPPGGDPMEFKRAYKTGTYNNCVEFLELYIESEVNTEYYQEEDEYPAYKGDKIGNYNQPYFNQYNGSYSINNVSKTFVTKEEECDDTNGKYPARYVWSDQRLYQADGSGFITTDGFSKFRVLSRFDLDEQYGGINKLIDLGDDVIHFLMDRKVRIEPIDRDIIQTADGGALTTGGTQVVGKGGYYLPYDSGCQHMRTAKQTGGMFWFADADKRKLIMSGSRGSNWSELSDLDVNAFFNQFLDGTIREMDLIGIVNKQIKKDEYWLIKNGQNKDAIIYNSKNNTFKTRINSKEILGGIFVDGTMYLLRDDVWSMYTGERGNFFDEYKNSSLQFVINDYPSAIKLFNVLTMDMEGELELNTDTMTALVRGVGANTDQVASLLTYTSYILPPPLQFRNGMYWINRIRTPDQAKLRGTNMEVTLDIVNKADKTISISAVVANCEASFRNP